MVANAKKDIAARRAQCQAEVKAIRKVYMEEGAPPYKPPRRKAKK